jgi:2-desacetyl-2-hydroxyethyl bacteriochlorophyllide A dehydrogenase
MQAVVIEAPHRLSIKEVAGPEVGPHEVLVAVKACGLCGTDQHIYEGAYLSNYPVIPGHEFSGVVEEVGSEVTTFQVGARVTVDPNVFCGGCYFCRLQKGMHCQNWEGIGVTRNGGFAEYAVAPVRNVYPIPDEITFEEAAFVEPLSCVVYAMQRLRVWPGDEVLIFGSGPMGLLLLQALRHSGASRVVVVDLKENRLKLAKELGAWATVVAGPDQDEALRDLAPFGFAVVVDATGVPEVVERAFQYLKPTGQMLMFGVNPPEARISLSPFDIFKNDWHILGTYALCYTFYPAIALLEGGVVDVMPLLSHSLPLARFEEALEMAQAGETMKIQLQG